VAATPDFDLEFEEMGWIAGGRSRFSIVYFVYSITLLMPLMRVGTW